MRHYAVWIDADSIVPDNTAAVGKQMKALEKDSAALLITSSRAAYHSAALGLPVILFHYLPAGNTVMVSPIVPTDEFDHIKLAAPFPWSAVAGTAVAAARSSLGENTRKSLIPLPRHGLI